MGRRSRMLFGWATAMALIAGGQAPASAAVGQVHGDGAMAAFCTQAQKAVAGTALESTNVLQPSVEDFIASDAAPWDDEAGLALPLTTQQFTSTAPHPSEDRTMDTVVSCKLKSAEALQYHYGSDAAELGHLCLDAHAAVVDAVYDNLTPPELGRLVHDRSDVVLEPDLVSWGGPDWTSPFPPEVARIEVDGRLHLRAKALVVPRVFPVPIVGPPKRGVHYCHLASPDLVRELVVGDITAQPDAPPVLPD